MNFIQPQNIGKFKNKGAGRRTMFFREDAQRDRDISDEEWDKRYGQINWDDSKGNRARKINEKRIEEKRKQREERERRFDAIDWGTKKDVE